MPKAKKQRGHALRPRELATIQAQRELGATPYAIAKKTGHAENTVRKYLASAEAYSTPEMRELIEKIKEGEVNDLVVLTTKARSRLHELAPRMNPIEAIALMDRTFQQRRLLEGNSTSNIATISKIVLEAAQDFSRPKPKEDVLDAQVVERHVVDIEEEAHGKR